MATNKHHPALEATVTDCLRIRRVLRKLQRLHGYRMAGR